MPPGSIAARANNFQQWHAWTAKCFLLASATDTCYLAKIKGAVSTEIWSPKKVVAARLEPQIGQLHLSALC